MKEEIQQQAIPGIIGGLGPLAHIEFENRLIAFSSQRGAVRDRNHPAWILINATDVPDRTQSLFGQLPDCTPWLVKYGKMLQMAGANFLVVTCNTAHGFYQTVQPELDIPWIHLMNATAAFIKSSYPQYHRVGVLATTGTLQAKIYHNSLTALGLTAITPPLYSQLQKDVMDAIYNPVWGIKATGIEILPEPISILDNAMKWLEEQGTELVIAGCTEISVVLKKLKCHALIDIDPLDILANLTLDLAFGHQNIPIIRPK
ncbi:MAG: aspartate/glutamate racemase family protein [Okeania sp. SIO3I5]|uniref:aspartate/glutamate racemase family protein n=1 Tax=Okeania sp. SIO3I5 TaxID=2607805 RepID=UPI0013BB7F7A|nr:amino acid racemase [Okeania sp. SIO3I5]NEQ40067.1 aspartate/glutamate racemase family protein [Okeania sp. SIO3I5]